MTTFTPIYMRIFSPIPPLYLPYPPLYLLYTTYYTPIHANTPTGMISEMDDYSTFGLALSPTLKHKLKNFSWDREGSDDDESFYGGDDDEDEMDDEENYTLGAAVEESLLLLLSALGVLHSAENKCLLLSMDNEPFRQVIFDQYIMERGGGTLQYWHTLLIQYFQTEPNTLRKCEELPWHLKICRKWNTLKDTLSELKTFDMMCDNSNLKVSYTLYLIPYTLYLIIPYNRTS